MENFKTTLLDLLDTIKGSGSFVTSGVANFTPPGLHIEGIGEIGFPLAPILTKEIIRLAHKAPFGKGSQTITDPTVRSAWEMDAGQLSFKNKAWDTFLEEILKNVKEGLGIEGQTVKSSLYKLLIYEPGDFFLPHKDSEKEPGMFGTLVIGLPSTHSGGELVVRFDGREETVDFSEAASNYKIPYSAFFADCDHELKPVTAGYRVALVYNLLQAKSAAKLSSPKFSAQVAQLTALLESMSEEFEDRPKAVLLGHQYTPTNFSLSNLKLHDKPRAEALLEAAEKAGYFAGLGLVTHYLEGELEEDYSSRKRSYRRRYWEEDDEDEGSGEGGTMGEVYESSTQIEHWSIDNMPTLGDIELEEEDILTNIELGDGDPIEQEQEGYTGNAGMTIEYWYHYGAVILYPKSKQIELVSAAGIDVRLHWLKFYLAHWDNAELNARDNARQLIAGFTEEELTNRNDAPDFSPVAAVLLKMGDEKFILEKFEALLVAVFEKIPVTDWTGLLQQFRPEIFAGVFEVAANRGDVKVTNHLLEVLKVLDLLPSPALKSFLLQQIEGMPDYLKKAQVSELKETKTYYGGMVENRPRKEAITAILEKAISLCRHKEQDNAWLNRTVKIIAWSLPRKYVNEVLAAILLRHKPGNGALAQALLQICIRDLSERTEVMPTPPPNWKRELPDHIESYDKANWETLASFLAAPDQQVFDYRMPEAARKNMESSVSRATIDLKMETIRQGSPHTLRLTKTQAAYELSLKYWKEDVALLKQLKEG